MALVITVLHEVLLRELAPPLGGHLVRARARARVRVRFRVRVRVSLRLAATRLRESHRPMWNTCRVRVRARVRVRVRVMVRVRVEVKVRVRVRVRVSLTLTLNRPTWSTCRPSGCSCSPVAAASSAERCGSTQTVTCPGSGLDGQLHRLRAWVRVGLVGPDAHRHHALHRAEVADVGGAHPGRTHRLLHEVIAHLLRRRLRVRDAQVEAAG